MKESNASQPKILVSASTFPRWKNDTQPAFVLELSKRLCPDCEITVLAPHSSGSKMLETMAEMCVIRFPYFFKRFEKLAMSGGGILNRLQTNPLYYLVVPFFLLGQIWALVRLLKREKFDLVHAHWLISQGVTAVIALSLARKSIPLLCTSHGGDLFALRGGFLQKIKKWVIDKSQGLTVVSATMKNTVVEMGIDAGKIEVISMGVDLKHLFVPDPSISRSDNEILFVGRLVEKKGVRTLLEALPQVIAHHPEARLTVAGSGPMEDELKDLAAKLGLTDKVNFLGMVAQSELPGLYSRAALAVFPFMIAKSGDQEGFGLVQVEAMGCECPVIAGDLPAIHDTITHEETGVFFPSGNAKAMADAINGLLGNRDLRFRLAQEARRRVEKKYDWEVIAEKYATLYKKLIEH